MTTSQMMKASNVELFSLLLSLANQEDSEIESEAITAILASRGIRVTLEGFEG